VTTDEAVAKLDALSGDDPDGAHCEADDVLLALVPTEVADAYQRVMERCPWWATA